LVERLCEPIDRLFGFATRTLGVERVWADDVVRAGASGTSRSTSTNAASNFFMWRLSRIIRSAIEVFTSWLAAIRRMTRLAKFIAPRSRSASEACFLVSMPG
jgi:hypothetical protein